MDCLKILIFHVSVTILRLIYLELFLKILQTEMLFKDTHKKKRVTFSDPEDTFGAPHLPHPHTFKNIEDFSLFFLAQDFKEVTLLLGGRTDGRTDRWTGILTFWYLGPC